ncbi:phage terminase small subunit [Cytobacillus oceanisediminis]|uniref:phage terminase small subunit n=1 Tax=Cytobacillus oceanisediminis TaxID=665099 RepID=UPI00255162D7|nr:phage terminase small subunit [Cytobacillus oceanisediminis]MDK7666521.1 phage terminase small subunit [Cytobacillus oceanisediminis]
MNWGKIRKEFETTKITLKELSEKHDVKIGTLKSRKSREGWSRDPTKKDATQSKKDATHKNEDAARKRSGNPNPKNQFTKRNKAAEKHGIFSKFLPEESLEIMDHMQEHSPADLIWDQIQIQYAAIIRAQRIMFVENKDDITKVLKKKKDSDSAEEREWEYQFAWDKHANYLNAQSRAMGELRSLIKQFDEMAHIDDERRLKLELMRANIEKTKAEIKQEGGDASKVVIVNDKEAMRKALENDSQNN